MEHFKNPENYGALSEYDCNCELKNVSCGDVVEVWLKMDGDVLKKFGFEGRGCAISQASMSILSEEMLGMKKDEILKISSDDIIDIVGVDLGPTRLKCALLGLSAVKKALKGVS
jgi:nitrogen fixation NifU-like protein